MSEQSLTPPISLERLNSEAVDRLLPVCGGFFEHSPWIVEQALTRRPFSSLAAFHAACMETIAAADDRRRVELIAAHPDLVGRLAREGRLTRESTAEQAAAGLDRLSGEEADAFEHYNAAYRERFGFPFVICARENRKEAILAAFPRRLQQSRAAEIETAIEQIGQIAWLRMQDAITP